MNNTQYIPGVCNIGPAEIRLRQRTGWIAIALTAILWSVMAYLGAGASWRLLLFFPSALSAVGFIQARMHFCAAFGMRGLFNFGSEVGRTDSALQAEFRAEDRKKALQIIVYSVLAGLIVASIAYFVS